MCVVGYIWVPNCFGELSRQGFPHGPVPPEAVKVLAMLDTEGVIVKEGDGEFLQDLADNFPIGRTEVSAKGLTTREEKLVGNYV